MRTLQESIRDTINAMEKVQLYEGKYWENKGRYEDEAKQLQALVPTSGKAETMQGEIMRAASKIYYDLFNNGFGNNWTGALDFLKEHADLPEHIYEELNEYAGGTVVGNDKHLEEVVESMVSHAVRHAMDHVDPTYPAEDMWELQRDPYDMYDGEFDQDEWDDEEHYDDDDDDEDEVERHLGVDDGGQFGMGA